MVVKGEISKKYTPDLFKEHVKKTIDQILYKEYENRVVFLKSWNEWAEGNYIEPDRTYGKEFLKKLKK